MTDTSRLQVDAFNIISFLIYLRWSLTHCTHPLYQHNAVAALTHYMKSACLLNDVYLLCSGKVFLFHPPMNVSEGDELIVSFLMSRSKENHRLMEVELGCQMKQSSGKLLTPLTKKFYIEWTREQNTYSGLILTLVYLLPYNAIEVVCSF